jgi:hypothetical protein
MLTWRRSSVFFPAAAEYAAAISGDPIGSTQLLASIETPPINSVNEDQLIEELQNEAERARSWGIHGDATRMAKLEDAAQKMEAAKRQDERWVENHAGKDVRADAELAKRS